MSTSDDIIAASAESELHRRHVGSESDVNIPPPPFKAPLKTPAAAVPATTEDDDMEPLPSQPSGAHMIIEDSNIQVAMQYFERLLVGLDPRWRNWIIRGIFSWVMIFGFAKLVSMGPLVVSLVVLLIQIKCFQEIINIGYVVYKSHNLPWFRTLSWYFLFTSNYWLYGESLIHHFGFMMHKNNFLQPLVTYHRMIAFLLYTSGFVGFVLSLKKTYYLKQFTLFGYTHITLMILVTSSHQMIQNICEGKTRIFESFAGVFTPMLIVRINSWSQQEIIAVVWQCHRLCQHGAMFLEAHRLTFT